jgi:hypothetical protein
MGSPFLVVMNLFPTHFYHPRAVLQFAQQYRRYPDDRFRDPGKTGRWHAETARRRILRWIDLKARVGFPEWDSNVYYPITMAALLNLADFAPDAEIAHRAVLLLNVMFFDMAVDSLRGTYGTSHGRTYSGVAGVVSVTLRCPRHLRSSMGRPSSASISRKRSPRIRPMWSFSAPSNRHMG